MSYVTTAERRGLRLESLPDHLLLEILQQLPEDLEKYLFLFDGDGEEEQERKTRGVFISSRGAVEQVSRRLRQLCHNIPASRLAFGWGWEEPVRGEVGSDFAGRVLAALGGRPVQRVEFINAPDGLPPQFWTELGEGLVVQAQSLLIRHELWKQRLAPGALGLLQLHFQSLQELHFDMVNSKEDKENEALPGQLAAAIRNLTDLRRVYVHTVPLMPGLAAALAGLPHLESVEWGGTYLPAEASPAWVHMAQLGTRLSSLDVYLHLPELPLGPAGFHLPSGLLALTGLGSMYALLFGWDDEFEDSLPGLNRIPLQGLHTDGCTPVEVWTCPQLEELVILNDPLPLPPPDTPASQLSPLKDLSLHCWNNQGRCFPSVLCQLSGLTSLSLRNCKLAIQGALPPEFSQLRSLERLDIQDTALDAASLSAIALLASLTRLSLDHCGIDVLPAGAYLGRLLELRVGYNAFQPWHMPLPAVVASGTALQILGISLDADEGTLREQWKYVEGVLCQLPAMEDLHVSFVDDVSEVADTGHWAFRYRSPPPSHKHAEAVLRQLLGSSGLGCKLLVPSRP